MLFPWLIIFVQLALGEDPHGILDLNLNPYWKSCSLYCVVEVEAIRYARSLGMIYNDVRPFNSEERKWSDILEVQTNVSHR